MPPPPQADPASQKGIHAGPIDDCRPTHEAMLATAIYAIGFTFLTAKRTSPTVEADDQPQEQPAKNHGDAPASVQRIPIPPSRMIAPLRCNWRQPLTFARDIPETPCRALQGGFALSSGLSCCRLAAMAVPLTSQCTVTWKGHQLSPHCAVFRAAEDAH